MKRNFVQTSHAKNIVRRQIRKNSVVNFPFVFINVIATIVAAYELLADSTAVVRHLADCDAAQTDHGHFAV